MNSPEELKELLKKAKRTRGWLAEQTGYKETSVKQYLGGCKSSRPFFSEARKVLLAELARHSPEAKPPIPWELLFETEEQFRRVDRASRRVNAEGLIEFCRETLLQRANAILNEEDRKSYPTGKESALKVAENPPKGSSE